MKRRKLCSSIPEEDNILNINTALLIVQSLAIQVRCFSVYLCTVKKSMLNRVLLLIIAGTITVQAQPNPVRDSGRMSPEQYIEMFKEAAVADMKRTGVPASITLAQGMYESDYGNSDLAVGANNHFGIKCHKGWEGPTFHKDDDAPNECFRKYESVLHSYDDHSDFLRSRERYHSLFDLEITDYKGWSRGLKKAGYATNPAYPEKLIGLIEKYNLNVLDKEGVSMPVTAANASVKADVRPSSSQGAATETVKTIDASNLNTVNGVPFVYARKGDTWTKIARENSIELWQVLEFNDAGKNDILKEGELVYVKTKKNKAAQPIHVFSEGETMRSISQQYGIKLSKLYKMNEMEYGTQPASGTQIYLKRAMLFGIVL